MGRNYSTYISLALLVSACSREPSMPVLYAGGAGGSDNAAGASGSAGAGGAAGGGSALSPKARCSRPDGWPTLDTVLSMAEPLPATGDVGRMVMTPRGLHWLVDDGLYRLRADGEPEVVASTETWGSAELVASNKAVVWLWGGSIWALALADGATPVELATDINITGNPLLVDDTHVYYEPAFTTPGGLRRIPLTGGPPEIVQTTARDVLVVHGGYAYYSETYSIGTDLLMRARVTGGAAEQVDDGVERYAPTKLVFDGNVLYVSTTNIRRIELGTPDSGSTVLTLAPAPQRGAFNYLTSLALMGDRVVYADGNGTVGWVTTDGMQCANILVDPDHGTDAAGQPIEVALDDEYLYMLVTVGQTAEGSLHRIRRGKIGL